MSSEIRVIGIAGIPEVAAGNDLASLIAEAAGGRNPIIEQKDILVITQKVVSKAEGRVIPLDGVQPSPAALQLSEGSHKDPRLMEVILRESVRIVRMDMGNIISETRHGFNCANAGVDASNLPGQGTVSLLPIDPDASAENIRRGILERMGVEVAVIISDTFGRPWREGAVNVAIGVSGMVPLKDYKGREDSHGRMMWSTVIAIADELAATAELVMGKVERVPVALIRGFKYDRDDADVLPKGARALIRPQERDMFR